VKGGSVLSYHHLRQKGGEYRRALLVLEREGSLILSCGDVPGGKGRGTRKSFSDEGAGRENRPGSIFFFLQREEGKTHLLSGAGGER